MPGQLNKAIQAATKQVIADLGDAFNSSITFTKKTSGLYNTATGNYFTTDTTFSNIKVPIEFIRSSEETGFQENVARMYITPDLIGDSQPLLQDEITLTYAGSSRAAQIVEFRTYKGGQEYLYIVQVRF